VGVKVARSDPPRTEAAQHAAANDVADTVAEAVGDEPVVASDLRSGH
jgi:hypothetical protein